MLSSFLKLEKTSDKLSIVTWIIFVLILVASFLAYLILQNSRSYAKVINYSGKIRGNIQREVKLVIAGDYRLAMEVEQRINSLFLYLDHAAENLKLPFLDYGLDFRPEAVMKCYAKLQQEIARGASAQELVRLSERCWVICDATTDFYQTIAERNFKILEMLFYFNMILVGVLAGILIKINIEEIKGDLEYSATYDNLTRLFNRHSFIKIFDRVLNQPIKKSLIYFDIDHFKQINDTFGHDVGDLVLKKVARVVRKTLRRDDVVARWGGEEFVVLLPNTDKKAATVVAEKLRKAIKELEIPQLKGRKVTASFGVTEIKKGDTLDSAIKRADEALYEAKRSGRDRVVSK